MNEDTFAKRVADQGLDKDQRDYSSLKESHEREVAGTRQYYERLRREKYTDEAARDLMRQKGYNIALLK